MDYKFEEALRDEERMCDWDEREPVNDDEDFDDDWDDEPMTTSEYQSMKLSRSDMGW